MSVLTRLRGRPIAAVGIGLILIGVQLHTTAASKPVDNSSDTPAYNLMRRALELLEGHEPDPSCAVTLMSSAVKLLPSDRLVQNNYAYALERNGELDDALIHYRRASAIDPKWKLPYYGIADVLLETGRYADAILEYERGLRLPAADENDRKNDEKTIEHLGEIQKRNPGYITAQTILAFLQGSLSADAIAGARGIIVTYEEDGKSRECVAGLRLSAIFFAYNKDAISPWAHAQVDALGSALKEFNLETHGISIRLVGHASPEGSDAYNLELSERRVSAVRQYLASNFGVPVAHVPISAKGEEEPIRLKDGKIDVEHSRRVELIRDDACR